MKVFLRVNKKYQKNKALSLHCCPASVSSFTLTRKHDIPILHRNILPVSIDAKKLLEKTNKMIHVRVAFFL